ncbi:VOC family protein [Peristeroidobacter soli]|uniref:VOC family protein n=1 Tax=Peristeroidobacter soli TaxID=2497877 RepID=UPI001C376CD1|nr:VOC family protein [Peristeroidobacter soli]
MIHHLAIAPRDFKVAHKFYTEAMGFKLAKVVKRQALGGAAAGWTKHVFYETGRGGLFALWDLHLAELEGKSWKASWSSGLGLPTWINHVAFLVDSPAELEAKKQRWLDYGLRVSQVKHEFITSIYTLDPDKNLVEFTVATGPITEEDRAEALRLLEDDSPATIPEYPSEMFEPSAR